MAACLERRTPSPIWLPSARVRPSDSWAASVGLIKCFHNHSPIPAGFPGFHRVLKWERTPSRRTAEQSLDIPSCLSSNSKCNTSCPDGLRCCYANQILQTPECRRTCNLEPRPRRRPFVAADGKGIGPKVPAASAARWPATPGSDRIEPARRTHWRRRERGSHGASGNSVIPGCGRTSSASSGRATRPSRLPDAYDARILMICANSCRLKPSMLAYMCSREGRCASNCSQPCVRRAKRGDLGRVERIAGASFLT